MTSFSTIRVFILRIFYHSGFLLLYLSLCSMAQNLMNFVINQIQLVNFSCFIRLCFIMNLQIIILSFDVSSSIKLLKPMKNLLLNCFRLSIFLHLLILQDFLCFFFLLKDHYHEFSFFMNIQLIYNNSSFLYQIYRLLSEFHFVIKIHHLCFS